MDTDVVKLKIMAMVSQADASLSPQADHVSGNWLIPIWEAGYDDFPKVFVHVNSFEKLKFGSTLSDKTIGANIHYYTTIRVHAESMDESRALVDKIQDYLFLHDKQPDTKIIEIKDFSSHEAVTKKGAKFYRRMELSFTVVTEEKFQ